jgi:hypothetical protein
MPAMNHWPLVSTALLAALAVAPTLSCASHSSNAQHSGSQTGDADASTAGAPLNRNDHLIANLLGGSLGAGGGFLIGVSRDTIEQDKTQARADAIKASQRAEKNPARPEQVVKASTGDLNKDGFVTIDEVVAMRQANLNDQQMLDRLRQTGEIFELTEYQQDYLRTRGVSDNVIRQLPAVNQGVARTASDADHPRKETPGGAAAHRS